MPQNNSVVVGLVKYGSPPPNKYLILGQLKNIKSPVLLGFSASLGEIKHRYGDAFYVISPFHRKMRPSLESLRHSLGITI